MKWLDWAFVGRNFYRFAIPIVFIIVGFVRGGQQIARDYLGGDGLIYHRAASLWVAGGDPWSASVSVGDITYPFSALPTTVVLFAPFTILSEPEFTVVWIAISIGAALYTIKRCGLSWWYVLFPPVVEGVVVGNPSLVLIALLVAGRPWASAIAAGLKVYAVVPLIGLKRWRHVAAVILMGGLTLLAAPLWIDYLLRVGEINTRLTGIASGYGALAHGVVAEAIALALLAVLYRLDPKSASWLAIPAAWPATHLHYGTMAMPIMRRWPWVALILAAPVRGAAVVCVAIAIGLLLLQRREGRATSDPAIGDQ